jgi:hypothetical protein
MSDDGRPRRHRVVPEPLNLADGACDVQKRAGLVHSDGDRAPLRRDHVGQVGDLEGGGDAGNRNVVACKDLVEHLVEQGQFGY